MMMGRAGTGSLPGACFPWSELHFHLCFWPAFIFFPRPLQIFSFSVLELWVVLFCWNPFLFPCKTLVFSSSSFHPLEACWVLMSTDCALLFSFVVCHLQPKAVRHNLGYTQTVVNSVPLRLNSLVFSFLYSPTLTSIHDHRKNHSLD